MENSFVLQWFNEKYLKPQYVLFTFRCCASFYQEQAKITCFIAHVMVAFWWYNGIQILYCSDIAASKQKCTSTVFLCWHVWSRWLPFFPISSPSVFQTLFIFKHWHWCSYVHGHSSQDWPVKTDLWLRCSLGVINIYFYRLTNRLIILTNKSSWKHCLRL